MSVESLGYAMSVARKVGIEFSFRGTMRLISDVLANAAWRGVATSGGVDPDKTAIGQSGCSGESHRHRHWRVAADYK